MGMGDSQSDPSTATDVHMAPGQTAVEGDLAFRVVKTERNAHLQSGQVLLASCRAGTVLPSLGV